MVPFNHVSANRRQWDLTESVMTSRVCLSSGTTEMHPAPAVRQTSLRDSTASPSSVHSTTACTRGTTTFKHANPGYLILKLNGRVQSKRKGAKPQQLANASAYVRRPLLSTQTVQLKSSRGTEKQRSSLKLLSQTSTQSMTSRRF